MKNYYILFLITISVLLSSCSKNNSPMTPAETDTYLPTTLGSYWVSETYQHTDSSDVRLPGPPVIDSLIVEGTESKLGIPCTIFNDYILNNNVYSMSSSYDFYTDGLKVYTWSSLVNEQIKSLPLTIPLQLAIPDQWLLVVNPDATSWQLANVNLPDTTIIMTKSNNQITVNISQQKITIDGQNDGSFADSVAGTPVTSYKYTLTMNYSSVANISIFGFSIGIKNITAKHPTDYWFVKNIGNIRTVSERGIIYHPNVKTGGIPSLYTDSTYIPGSDSHVIRYKITN